MNETTLSDVVLAIPPEQIPDGTYSGVWGGYRVTFRAQGATYNARASNGIRTPNAPCRVTVESGRMTVEVL